MTVVCTILITRMQQKYRPSELCKISAAADGNGVPNLTRKVLYLLPSHRHTCHQEQYYCRHFLTHCPSATTQEQYGSPPTDRPSDSLRNLSAYLTLANARDKLGFDPANYGLTEQEAGNIAYAFSVYDTNDNGKLDLSELSTLWCVCCACFHNS